MDFHDGFMVLSWCFRGAFIVLPRGFHGFPWAFMVFQVLRWRFNGAFMTICDTFMDFHGLFGGAFMVHGAFLVFISFSCLFFIIVVLS